jgi:putative transposase
MDVFTKKYRPEYPNQGFKSLEAARTWAAEFVQWYAYEHQHSGLNFVTPHQCHTGEYIEILEKRKEVYEQAKAKHLERWSRSTRDWSAHKSLALNPMKDQREDK